MTFRAILIALDRNQLLPGILSPSAEVAVQPAAVHRCGSIVDCAPALPDLSRLQVEQKAALKRKRPYINGVCTCEKDGVPSASTETAHSMFCQLYRCYAYEAGGCDGRVDPPKSKDDPTIMTGWECECIQFAFDPDYDTGGENADLLISRSRRHVRSHVDEYGLIDRPGGRALRCNCECNYVGGPYVPMCPFRPHGVTGLARGDMYKRLRAAWDGRGGWEWEEPPEDLRAHGTANEV